jgi:hypothetical protein
MTPWTDLEIEELKRLAPQCTISEAARRLGRTYSATASRISALGIGVRYGNRLRTKIKWGSGFTKATTSRLVRQLGKYQGGVRPFAVQRGLNVEMLIKAIQKYESEFWAQYVKLHSELEERICPQCLTKYVPFNKKQLTCSRKCAALRRSDLKYFGGKRSNAIGMTEGICQLCDKEKPSLSAHHVFGKANDPEHDFMIALCHGCHQLIGYLGGRTDVQSEAFWENLIALALCRRMGRRKPLGFHVWVDIEELEESDLEEYEIPALDEAAAARERATDAHAKNGLPFTSILA